MTCRLINVAKLCSAQSPGWSTQTWFAVLISWFSTLLWYSTWTESLVTAYFVMFLQRLLNNSAIFLCYFFVFHWFIQRIFKSDINITCIAEYENTNFLLIKIMYFECIYLSFMVQHIWKNALVNLQKVLVIKWSCFAFLSVFWYKIIQY